MRRTAADRGGDHALCWFPPSAQLVSAVTAARLRRQRFFNEPPEPHDRRRGPSLALSCSLARLVRPLDPTVSFVHCLPLCPSSPGTYFRAWYCPWLVQCKRWTSRIRIHPRMRPQSGSTPAGGGTLRTSSDFGGLGGFGGWGSGRIRAPRGSSPSGPAAPAPGVRRRSTPAEHAVPRASSSEARIHKITSGFV